MTTNNTETTTLQIIVPGLEKAVSDILSPIVAANNTQIAATTTTVASNISSVAGKLSSPVISRNNNEVSPYPTFAIWTNDNNNKAGFNIINSDFQSIATNSMPNYFGGYQSPDLDNMPNWYEDFRSYTYTQGNFGSSTVTTYFGGSTVWGSADGHVIYRPNNHGGFAGNWINRADNQNQYLIRCGTIIGVWRSHGSPASPIDRLGRSTLPG